MTIGLDCRFEPLESSYLVAETPCTQTVRQTDAAGLLFVLRGRVDLCLPTGRWEIGAKEGFHFHLHGQSKALMHLGTGAALYLLRYRMASSPGANLVLKLPTRSRVHNPERLTDLLRRYIAEEELDHPSSLLLYHLIVLALCELTEDSGMRSVARIARMCGFSDASHFRRLFKRVTGMTPNHYRTAVADQRDQQPKECLAAR